MATGGGHVLLTESMAILGIHPLTKKSFMPIKNGLASGGGLFLRIQ